VNVPFLVLLTGLGFAGAFVAGLLGVGGAILMIPLLLYVPPWLGFPGLDIRVIAAISMVQVFFAALSGAIAHGRQGVVHRGLTVTVGALTALGSLAGGVASRWLPSYLLLAIFGVMASLGAVLMWAAPPEPDAAEFPTGTLPFRRARAMLVGGGVGLGAGLVGAGGAFLLVPLLITFVGVPTRIIIGTSLAITLWTATAGLVGKIVTGQVPFALSAALVLGAAPGAHVGEWVSRRFAVRSLTRLLAVVMTLVALKIWVDVLFFGR
jgi:uncharacterized membrane protein YfcA